LLKVCKLYKAPGNNCIPNGFFKAIGPKLAEVVVQLANAYWVLGYFLVRFKEVWTVVFCKPGKPSYNNLGTWWPIAFLNIIGKLIKSLIAKRLS